MAETLALGRPTPLLLLLLLLEVIDGGVVVEMDLEGVRPSFLRTPINLSLMMASLWVTERMPRNS